MVTKRLRRPNHLPCVPKILSVLLIEKTVDKAITRTSAIRGLSSEDLINSIFFPVTTLRPKVISNIRKDKVISASLLKEKNSVVVGRKKIGTRRMVRKGIMFDTLSSIDVLKLDCFIPKVYECNTPVVKW